MGDHTKYGFCKGECQKWKKRDDMLSVNLDIFDANQNKRILRVRMCPSCHEKFVTEMEEKYKWDNNLVEERDIRMCAELASQSDVELDLSLVEDTRAKEGLNGRSQYV